MSTPANRGLLPERAAIGTKEAEVFDTLARMIAAYEDERWPIERGSAEL